MKNTMKKILCTLLACGLLLSQAACGGQDSTGNEDNSSGSPQQSGDIGATQPNNEPEMEAETLTMADAQVRLIYTEGNYVVLAYHGPYNDDIGIYICKKGGDGSNYADSMQRQLSPGWILVICDDLPEGETVDDIGLTVSDESAERDPDGSYHKTIFTDFGEAMSLEEQEAIGVTYIDGHMCCVYDAGPGYSQLSGADYFSFMVYIAGYGKDSDFLLKDSGLTEENFQFYTGDGTPLGEAFEGYNMEVDVGGTVSGGGILVTFHDTDPDSTVTKNKEMNEALVECQPYMVYIGTDGTTYQFPLLQN